MNTVYRENLYAEAKGRTSSAGLDVDTLYRRLLRRMNDPATDVRYAVVVPTAALQAALRVPSWERDRLHIDVCAGGRRRRGAPT
jgi:hypothetical protein